MTATRFLAGVFTTMAAWCGMALLILGSVLR